MSYGECMKHCRANGNSFECCHRMCSSAHLREALQGAGGDDAAIAHLACALEATDSPTLAIWKFCDGLDKVVGDGDRRAALIRSLLDALGPLHAAIGDYLGVRVGEIVPGAAP